jgi:Kef-type K+ transport system membrane component KefB
MTSGGGARLAAFYGGLVAVTAGAFFWVRSAGERLAAPPPAAAAAPAAVHGVDTLFHALLALAVIVVTARLVGALFARLGQPPVMGEVLGGILLGPSFLGRLAPDVLAQLMPAGIVPFLGIHAQLGVILYLFLVGLELDLGVLRRSTQVTLAISHASILVPFLLGSLLALRIYPTFSTSDVPFTVFALFIAVSLSVTAFPVLARILTDRRISRTRMGIIALACAAIDDVTAWCLLALVVAIAQARASAALVTVVATAAFVAAVLMLVAPLVARIVPRLERSADITRTSLGIVLIATLASAMTTQYIGIHGFFGAFLFGAIIPHGSRLAAELKQRLDDVVAVLFLPVFFAFTGMRTEIGLLDDAASWTLCGVVILAACAGKFGGAFFASRFSGLTWRDSAALGILMNTRGLVELIVLNIGLDLHVISPRLFTILVIMACVTTFMTAPVLGWLLKKHPWVEPAGQFRS